jgi:hypothetical protein
MTNVHTPKKWGVIVGVWTIKKQVITIMPRSIEQIKADYKNQNLRAVVRDMMKANPKLIYTVAGKEWTAGEVGRKGKVADMIQHISLWEGKGQLEKPVTECRSETVKVVDEATDVIGVVEAATDSLEKIDTVKSVETVKVTSEEYTQSESEKLAIAKKIYYSKAQSDDLTGLQEYHLKAVPTKQVFST